MMSLYNCLVYVDENGGVVGVSETAMSNFVV